MFDVSVIQTKARGLKNKNAKLKGGRQGILSIFQKKGLL